MKQLPSDAELLRACRGDHVKAGMLKAAILEMFRQFDEIDRRVSEEQEKGLPAAFQALLRGDVAERDRICARLQLLPEAAAKAKQEIGLRIGERLGMDREQLERISS